MADFIIMPKLGLNMDTGTLVKWLKKAGEPVVKGEVVCEIETDKTVMEVESPAGGVVLRLLAEEGEIVPVTLPIAIVGKADADIRGMMAEAASLLGKSAESEPTEKSREPVMAAAAAVAGPAQRQFISPRARRYLQEHNVQAASITVSGTGPEGAITEADVIKCLQTTTQIQPARLSHADRRRAQALRAEPEASHSTTGDVPKQGVQVAPSKAAQIGALDERGRDVLAVTPYSGMRRIIGERLSESMFTAPHLYFTTSVDMSRLLELQKEFNAAQEAAVSLNVLIVRAAAKALQAYPEVNASLAADNIVQYRSINIGIAVAAPSGLIVPVVKNVQSKTLAELSRNTEQLIEKAKAGKLMPEDYQSGTFTISNLGMFGVENFTAILNPPEAAILSVSSIIKTPVVISGNGVDSIVVRSMMNTTLAVDHRLIDGLLAVRFLGAVKSNLEKPLCLLL